MSNRKPGDRSRQPPGALGRTRMVGQPGTPPYHRHLAALPECSECCWVYSVRSAAWELKFLTPLCVRGHWDLRLPKAG